MRIFNVDIPNLSDNEIKEIGRSVVKDLIVVIPNQVLSPEMQVAFCETIGKCQRVKYERSKHIALNDHILRVTGEKNESGEPGLFGHTSALDWHANQASNYERSPLIWLYADRGSRGSVTSWIDCKKAYEDLDEATKEEIADIKITLGYKKGNYSDSNFFYEHHNVDSPMSLVYTNTAGHTGLYFPFLQIFGMLGKNEKEFNRIMDKLKSHVLQDKYRYDHHWNDGDVVISEQWLTIHKRHYFENMENRVLHRIAFSYEDYTR